MFKDLGIARVDGMVIHFEPDLDKAGRARVKGRYLVLEQRMGGDELDDLTVAIRGIVLMDLVREGNIEMEV